MHKLKLGQKIGLAALVVVATACTATISATPASAQKSKDVLRLAMNTTVPTLSPFEMTTDDGGFFAHEVYETLILYDEYNKKLVPALAKSWKHIDQTTIEFELQDDVKFSNGDAFTADDVKATYDFIMNPKSKIQYPQRYNWIKSVEVLGPHTIRFHEAQPTATDLNLIAYRLQIWDGKALASLPDQGDYGRKLAIGTGAYKVGQLDVNKGIVLDRFDGHKTYDNDKKVHIGKVSGVPMPDRQTQSASLIAGELDVLRSVPPDIADSLIADPKFKKSYVNVPDLLYIALDAAGLAGNKALTDPRVRQAIGMAIDRETIIKYIVPGGEVAEHIQADCFQATIACGYSVPATKYNIEGAKKLLAEAGYANGFEMSYLVYTPNRPIGEAIAGDLRKVGIRVTIQLAELGLYRRLLGDGKLQAWTSLYPTGGYPDAGNILSSLFGETEMKYFNNDTAITDAMKTGEGEYDPAKRTAIYAKAFDRINEMHYHIPLSSAPLVFVHLNEVKVNNDPMSAGKIYASDFDWK